jgi:hypothetical protein
MVTGRALKTPDMQPQGDWTIQHGQIADTPGSAIFDPSAAPLAPRTNEVSVSALKMQFQLVGPDDLIGHTEFGQVEQGVDILKIHTSGSSCWVPGFSQHFARNPAWVNIYSKLLIINTMC